MNTFITSNRRAFLQKTGAAILTSSVILNSTRADTRKNNTLKVGLIGCGGRGNGAAMQALMGDPDTIITAMGDIFPDQIEKAIKELSVEYPERVQVAKEKQFIGFDAYKQVIASDVDVVLLATPPVFRPEHFYESVSAGKHTFCEKPMAIDAPGVRKIMEGAKKAKEKNVAVCSGFTFRYDYAKRAFYDRISKGQIGDIISVSTTRNGGQLWSKPKEAGWTDMEYRLKNWLYYSWLSGDFICEITLAFLVLFVVLAVIAWRRFGAAYGLFAALSLAIPLSVPSERWPLLSLPRFGLTIFPLFLALAVLAGRPRAHTAIVAVSSILLGVSVARPAAVEIVNEHDKSTTGVGGLSVFDDDLELTAEFGLLGTPLKLALSKCLLIFANLAKSKPEVGDLHFACRGVGDRE